MDISPVAHEPVSPVDVIGGFGRHRAERTFAVIHSTPSNQQTQESHSSSEYNGSLKTPRTARFAESTSVNSPIGPTESGRSPFVSPVTDAETKHDVSDVGFGYVKEAEITRHPNLPPLTPASPLKSALKSPSGRTLNPLSPTFREELVLEKQEKVTEKQNAKDLKVKTRVRIAKVFLRFVNFGCSLVILSLMTTTVTIFNTTKALPSRNNLPPWAIGTQTWPQILLLTLSGVSLFTCLIVFYGYWRGGHKRAEKVGVYYTVFSVGFFTFSVVMWVVGAAVFQNSKGSNGGGDIWSWSCKQNARSQLFQSDVNYSLICRLQDWSLLCSIIEVVIEIFVIIIYVVVFYRFYSKRRLQKTMELRDRARSDLYLAHLRMQSAPNTPGFPRTPKSPFFAASPVKDPYSAAENGESYSVQYATPKSPAHTVQQPFRLQPPPIRVTHATPKTDQGSFPEPATPSQTVNAHLGAAPGERTYEAVPIPGAYASPLSSPGVAPHQASFMAQTLEQGPPGTAFTTEEKVEIRNLTHQR